MTGWMAENLKNKNLVLNLCDSNAGMDRQIRTGKRLIITTEAGSTILNEAWISIPTFSCSGQPIKEGNMRTLINIHKNNSRGK